MGGELRPVGSDEETARRRPVQPSATFINPRSRDAEGDGAEPVFVDGEDPGGRSVEHMLPFERGAVDVVRGVVTDADVADRFNINAETIYYHKLAGVPDDLIVKPKLLDLVNHGLLDDGDLLEVGGGTGWFANAVLKSEIALNKMFFVELSRSMIEVASGALKDPRIRFIRASASKVPLPDRSVSVITSTNALDCVADLPGALRESNRLLPVGGVLAFSVRSPERNRLYADIGGLPYRSGYDSWYSEVFPGLKSPVLRRYMSTAHWHNLLKFYGFDIEVMDEPYAGDHVLALDRDVWEAYNRFSGRKSALLVRAVKVENLR
jgi:ubiquinone/menaquinone biosynthesis C-methylase UbiE